MRKLIVAVKELTDSQQGLIAAVAESHGFTPVQYDIYDETPKANAALLEDAKDAEIIFSGFKSLAGAAPHLKWFCTPYAGVEEYTEPGVFASPDAMLTNSTGAYGVTISEHVVMLTLEILRREPEYRNYISQRKWVRKLPVRSIHSSRILIMGTGDIGRTIAERFRGFLPASVNGFNRRGRNPDGIFDEVCTIDRLNRALQDTDICVMALPGTKKTRHIMDADRLSQLPDGAVLVNIGRGSCIDEKALEKELRSGRLYAALDVFETEPLPPDSTLWTCPNLRITPHVSGDMTLPYTKERAVEMFLENLERYAEGKSLLRQIDLEKGY